MRTKSGRGDVLLVCMVLFLVVFGLAVLYSTGSYNGSVRFGDAFYYMKKQFFAAALGMLAMYLISCMDYHIFEKYAIAAYLISLAYPPWYYLRAMLTTVPEDGSHLVLFPFSRPSLPNLP